MADYLDFSYYYCIFVPNMLHVPTIIKKTLSVRIGLMVVTAMAILLMASMVVMLYYSRKAVKEEATQKAQQALDGMVYSIDNIMLSVEQTTGNTYFSMLPHLDNPDMMFTYARKLVETNPYVAGCAIAFKEDFCKDCKPFMAYVHHADSAGVAYAGSDIVTDDMFGDTPYTEQTWYTEPLKTGKVEWMIPQEVMKRVEDPIFTLCLPIYTPNLHDTIGVIGVDVSISLLSDIVNAAKPSANSYCTLIDCDGTYIVHPNERKLLNETDDILEEQSAREAADAMISGGSGYKPFNLGGTDYYVFYKPFQRISITSRTNEDFGWYAGIVYPEDDIFGDYNSLSNYVLGIVVIGLLLSFLISGMFIHSQLKPLLMLTAQAQHIAKGHLDEPIPDSRREDEIGRLQCNFKLMQQSLATNIGELEQLTTELKKHGEELSIAYKRAQKADRMKTAFLHNMTNQMLEPSEAINKDVDALCDPNRKADQLETARLVSDIQQNGNTIADLLKNMINMSDEDIRKEVQDV